MATSTAPGDLHTAALEREAARNLGVIWLLRKLRPDFKTIADFRKDNAKE